MDNRLFDKYKNSVIPHERHIYTTTSYMAMATLCSYPPYQHALPQWKCVLLCCYNCPRIHLPEQESDRHHSKAAPSIRFHVYHLIALCKVHGRPPLD